MKILYIITQGKWGGAQRYVFDCATNLHSSFESSVGIGLKDAPQDLQARLKEKNIPYYNLKHLVRPISPLHDVLAIFELAKLYRITQPDVIHLNSSKAGVLGSLAALMYRKAKIVYTVHGWVFKEPLPLWKKTFYHVAEKITASIKDTFITISKTDYDTARNVLGVKQEKLQKIYHGISIPSFVSRAQAQASLTAHIPQRPTPEKLWVGTIASLYKTKGIDILVKAAALTSAPLEFFVIRDGPEKHTIKQSIKKYKFEQIFHIIPYVEDAAKLLKAFDIFVLPSQKEGFPYALLEAMHAGLPIVATNVGAVPGMIEHKKNGLVIKPQHPPHLAQALEELAESQTDRECYAQSAQERAQQFQLQTMIQETEKIYCQN